MNFLPAALPFFSLSNKGQTKMKSFTEYLWFNTKKHREYINITSQVEDILAKSGIQEGMILVWALILRPVCISTMPKRDSSRILMIGLKHGAVQARIPASSYGRDKRNSHLKSLLIHHEVMSRLQVQGWILAHGSKFIMQNSTASAANGLS